MAEASARRVGLKADGTPCLNCEKTKSGFCKTHMDQATESSHAAPAVYATVTLVDSKPAKGTAAPDKQPNTTPRRVGLKNDGTVCQNCAKTASGFCGQHVEQADDPDSVPLPKAQPTPAAPAAKQGPSPSKSSTSKPSKVDPKVDGTPKPSGKAPNQPGAKQPAAQQEDSRDEEEDSGEEEGGEEDLEDVEHATLVLGNKYPKFRRDGKSDSLEAERWLPKKALHISNVVNSGDDSRNWLELWADKTGRDRGLQKCAAAGCSASESKGDKMVGGHVWVQGQLGVRHCYIVPICSTHNNGHEQYDYPHWWPTKSDIALVRITTCREFVRGRCKPGEKRIYRFEMREREE